MYRRVKILHNISSHFKYLGDTCIPVLKYHVRSKVTRPLCKVQRSMAVSGFEPQHFNGQCVTMIPSVTMSFDSSVQTAKFLKRVEKLELSSSDGELVEKLLVELMDLWEVEIAVRLLEKGVNVGIFPKKDLILNLLQQTANLGEYEVLLSLHTLIENEQLCSKNDFFQRLKEAYCSSGRIQEGVNVLRILYHRIRKYENVDVFFTLLTIMILHHFPDKIGLIEDFVKDCMSSTRNQKNYRPAAGLWKCYVYVGNVKGAEKILSLDKEAIMEYIPSMISDIVNGRNHVEYDRVSVLKFLTALSFPVMDEKLTSDVYGAYLYELCLAEQWDETLEAVEKIERLSLGPKSDLIKRSLSILDDKSITDPDFKLIQCMEKLNTLCKSGS